MSDEINEPAHRVEDETGIEQEIPTDELKHLEAIGFTAATRELKRRGVGKGNN